MEESNDAEFLEKMQEVIQHNALGIAVEIGHRLGLFKTMIESTEPQTSHEIAAKAGLHER